MKTKLMYPVILAMLFCSYLPTSAQEKDLLIRGAVYDEYGPLPGVVVQIKGTSAYAVTNRNGEYSITVPSKKTILVFSMQGMIPQEKVVSNQMFINILLQSNEEYFTVNVG